MLAPISYLTVQDVLWINLQIEKRVVPFHYARLEEAVFHQYAYLHMKDLVAQAGRFLSAFLKNLPFDSGNELTALVACEAFLRINGWRLNLEASEASGWLDRARIEPDGVVQAAAEENPDFHPSMSPDVRAAAMAAIERLLPAAV